MTTMTVNYRVIEVLTNDFGAYNHGHPSKASESVKWSGTDLDELSRTFPPSNIFGADPLGHSELEDGLLRYDYRFEQQSADGTWEEIDDPRRRITPVTALELEIDAENRRRFPGDYVTDDDCGNCCQPGCEYCDPHEYYCDSCLDAGCDVCYPPPDCSNCDDRGCEQCDPEQFPPEAPCNDCCHWFEVKLLNTDGVCAGCQADRDEEAKPRCFDCGRAHTDTSLSNDDLCAGCETYYQQEYDGWQDQLHKRWYHGLAKRLINRLLRRK